jgi:predicted AlkP superfamily phosphohydrolase/phosphomutase
MAAAKRVIMLGLDGMISPLLEKFMEEGLLPHFSALVDRGLHTRLRAVIPPQTPSNWHTIATGATPGTHGVVQWGSHLPGEPVWEYHRHEAYHAALCRAEYLWESAARAGRETVVFNYVGFPPTTEHATFIDFLFTGRQSNFDLSAATVYHNLPEHNTTDLLTSRPATDWQNLPVSGVPALEAELPLKTSMPGTGPTYYLLLVGAKMYEEAWICASRDGGRAVAKLRPGEWSEWVTDSFETHDQGSKEGAFRFKLQELSEEGSRVSLYRTDAFPTDGSFCTDPELGRQLVEELGPYVFSVSSADLFGTVLPEWVETGDAYETLGLEWQTFDELLAAEARWWSQAARKALEAKDSPLLFLQWHVLDCVGHVFYGKIDPTGSFYEPERADFYWEIVRNHYRAADRLVGAFMEQLDDGATTFVLASDHGMVADVKAVSLINLFAKRGWVTLTPDGSEVDWAQSQVFFVQNHLWINLQGRDHGGIVPPERYASLREEILRTMRSLTDPETGEHVFAIVLPREDAPMLGLWGDYIGDLVCCYTGGYRWSGPEVLAMGEERVVFPCGGGNHGPMIPTYETETTSVMGALVMAGAGIRSTEVPRNLQARICTTDIAPTLAALLDIDLPAQNEGRILHEFLTDYCSEWPDRKPLPLARSREDIVPRPPVRPRPRALQGDDTDE